MINTEHHLPWAVSRQQAQDMGWAGAQDCWHDCSGYRELLSTQAGVGTFPDPSGHSTAPGLAGVLSFPVCVPAPWLLCIWVCAGDRPELLGLCLALLVPVICASSRVRLGEKIFYQISAFLTAGHSRETKFYMNLIKMSQYLQIFD